MYKNYDIANAQLFDDNSAVSDHKIIIVDLLLKTKVNIWRDKGIKIFHKTNVKDAQNN